MPKSQQQIQVSSEECPSPHSLKNKLGRVAWGCVAATLFRLSPRIFHGWRRFLLRSFGAKIGSNVKIDPSAMIWAPWNLEMQEESSLGHHCDCYCVEKIFIGSHATVSQYAMLCTASHSITDPNMELTSAPIKIEEQAWVCARAFIAPGITIEKGAVVGAQSVVTKNVPAWMVVAGNPAKEIKKRVLDSKSEIEKESE